MNRLLDSERHGYAEGDERSRRYVFVSLEYPPAFGGGIGTFVCAMTRILASQGHRVTVLTVTEDAVPCREHISIGEHGLEVVRVPLPRARGCEPGVTVRTWQDLSDRFAAYLRRMVDAEGDSIDAIEFPDYRGEGLTFLSSIRPTDRPLCVVRLHTPCVVLARYNRARERHQVLEAFENDAMRLADRLVSPSRALAREIVEDVSGLPPIDILAHPADPDFLAIDPDAERERLGIEPGDCGAEEILYVGRLEERKGVEALVAAAPEVLAACPRAILHLVGGDLLRGPDQPSMLEHLKSMLPGSIAHRVVFDGRLPRRDLIERYLRARVCVFPSLFENFPNTCLESMALARPTIGTDNSGMAEMIEHGVSGVIVKSGDVGMLAHELISLYNAPPEVRSAMGRAARERVNALYAPEVIGREYTRVMDSIAAARRTRPRSNVRVGGRRRMGAIAVVIPCFNHGAFLEETLDSVHAQTRVPDDIVVVDDGSTDARTLAVLRDVDGRGGVRVIRRPNGGLAAARNTGVRATSAEFFVPLDADDLIEPEFIATLATPLEADPMLGYAYSHAEYFDAHEGSWACPPYDPRRLLISNLSVATAVVRRRAFDLAGGYRESMRLGFEDWDFWLSLLDAGYHGVCVPEPLFLYRKHAGGSMLGRTQMSRSDIVRTMIDQHQELYESGHAWALVEKDRLFYEAHIEAWNNLVALNRERERSVTTATASTIVEGKPAPERTNGYVRHARGRLPAEGSDHGAWAQHELEELLHSPLFRAVRKFKASAAYKMLADYVYGPDWESNLDRGSARERLERLRASRGYRVIVTLRRTPVYRMWSKRGR